MSISNNARGHGRAIIYVLVALACLGAGLISARLLMDRSIELRAAAVFPDPRPIVEFELRKASGGTFRRADLEGRWSLLFFGFTNCPDICPDTMSMLAGAMDSLELMRRENLPQVVFISVDPERDSGDALERYVTWFNPEFLAVTGNDAQLQALTRQLGIVYYRGAADPATGMYEVEHSGSVLIIDPQGRLYGRFGPPIDSDDLVADLFRLTS